MLKWILFTILCGHSILAASSTRVVKTGSGLISSAGAASDIADGF